MLIYIYTCVKNNILPLLRGHPLRKGLLTIMLILT